MKLVLSSSQDANNRNNSLQVRNEDTPLMGGFKKGIYTLEGVFASHKS